MRDMHYLIFGEWLMIDKCVARLVERLRVITRAFGRAG